MNAGGNSVSVPAAALSVVLATRNAGKLRELAPLLESFGVGVVTLADLGIVEDDVEDSLEEFDTFEENALAKARYFMRLTGRVVFADDSGLSADALDGRPGVHSKRWSGRADVSGEALDDVNNAHLQRELDKAHATGRTARVARYVCAAACAWPAEGYAVERGETVGLLLHRPLGNDGFGYDPYFLSADLGVTFGVATRSEKELVSHRGRAFRRLLEEPRVCSMLQSLRI